MAPEDLVERQDDTLLQKQWIALQQSKAIAATPAELEQIKIAEEAMAIKFERIILDRRQGILTDTTRITPILDFIRLAASFTLPSLLVEIDEMHFKSSVRLPKNWDWRIVAFVDNPTKIEALKLIAKEVDDEINQKLPFKQFVCESQLGCANYEGFRFWIPETTFDESNPLATFMPGPLNGVAWIVETKIWNGPSGVKMRPS